MTFTVLVHDRDGGEIRLIVINLPSYIDISHWLSQLSVCMFVCMYVGCGVRLDLDATIRAHEEINTLQCYTATINNQQSQTIHKKERKGSLALTVGIFC